MKVKPVRIRVRDGIGARGCPLLVDSASATTTLADAKTGRWYDTAARVVAGSAGDTRRPAADGKAIATKRSCCEARIMRIYVEKSVDAREPKAMCRFASYR